MRLEECVVETLLLEDVHEHEYGKWNMELIRHDLNGIGNCRWSHDNPFPICVSRLNGLIQFHF
jgi:hypothetical protein